MLSADTMESIFAASLKKMGLGRQGGACGVTSLRGAFGDMKRALKASGATDDERRAFVSAIESAIKEAPELKKKMDQSAAVTAALAWAFDDVPRDIAANVVEYNFVARVRFDA